MDPYCGTCSYVVVEGHKSFSSIEEVVEGLSEDVRRYHLVIYNLFLSSKWVPGINSCNFEPNVNPWVIFFTHADGLK